MKLIGQIFVCYVIDFSMFIIFKDEFLLMNKWEYQFIYYYVKISCAAVVFFVTSISRTAFETIHLSLIQDYERINSSINEPYFTTELKNLFVKNTVSSLNEMKELSESEDSELNDGGIDKPYFISSELQDLYGDDIQQENALPLVLHNCTSNDVIEDNKCDFMTFGFNQ